MLREILRKMSRDDSTLQLKSLEQVLQLGHSIAQQDSQERLHELKVAQGHERRHGRTPSPRRSAAGGGHPPSGAVAMAPLLGDSRSNSFTDHTSDPEGPPPRRQPVPASAAAGPRPVAAATPVNLGASGASSNGSISRLAKVPGLTPDPTAKKAKKVFGHAVK